MKYSVGVDLGSTAIKVVFVQNNTLIWHKAIPTAPGQEALANKVIEEGIRELDISKDDILGVAATGYGKKQAVSAAAINSTCVVFAESEIVSLLAKGTPKESIIKGLHESIVRRIAGMMGTESVEGVYLDGGSANNTALAEAIEDELFTDVSVLKYPQFTVAFGAACSLQQ